MISQKTKLSIAFLKSHKPDYTQKDFDKIWKMIWRNIREENPSMRLTKGGYQFLKNTLDLKDYMVKLKRECKIKTRNIARIRQIYYLPLLHHQQRDLCI